MVDNIQKKLIELGDENTAQKPSMERLRATEQTWQVAKESTSSLALDTTQAQSEFLANNLLNLYYQDVRKILIDDLSTQDIQELDFQNFISGGLHAWAANVGEAKKQIFMDQILDCWIFLFTQVVSIRVFYPMDKELNKKSLAAVSTLLSALQTAESFQELASDYQMFFEDFQDVLPVTNCVNMAITGFVLCHEVGHHCFKHTNQKPEQLHELEADRFAMRTVNRLIKTEPSLQYLKITPNMQSAPCILMLYFALFETWSGSSKRSQIDWGKHSHPPASKRLEALLQFSQQSWSEEAQNLFSSYRAAIEEIARELNLQFVQTVFDE